MVSCVRPFEIFNWARPDLDNVENQWIERELQSLGGEVERQSKTSDDDGGRRDWGGKKWTGERGRMEG